jgi:hypothetical protein
MEHRTAARRRREADSAELMLTLSPPRTYFDWVETLNMLVEKSDDDAVLHALRQGTIEWQAGVSERFSVKLVDSVNTRLRAATERFRRDIDGARGQESYIAQAMIALRKEIAFLTQVIDLPTIPEDHRAQYYGMLRTQADAIQSVLEDSAKLEHTGKLGSIFRNHRINVF